LKGFFRFFGFFFYRTRPDLIILTLGGPNSGSKLFTCYMNSGEWIIIHSLLFISIKVERGRGEATEKGEEEEEEGLTSRWGALIHGGGVVAVGSGSSSFLFYFCVASFFCFYSLASLFLLLFFYGGGAIVDGGSMQFLWQRRGS